jgi:hypothetical protein
MGAFRRRILIQPSPDRVVAELEDDWHRMVVTLHHDSATITAIDSEMKRWPWTTCPGAMDTLAVTFVGVALGEVAQRGEKTANCTHLYDLTLFAAAHAGESQKVAYDVTVTDPIDDARVATIVRDGVTVLGWTLTGDTLLAPPNLTGQSFACIGRWIAQLDPGRQEAARILRWATILSYGRQMTIPAGSSGRRFASGTCYTFTPVVAESAFRNRDADRDFSGLRGPLANRESHFTR